MLFEDDHAQSSRSVLCKFSRSNFFHLASLYVRYRNTALQNRRTKKSTVFIGPTRVHYRNDSHSYAELLDYLRQELQASV